MYLKLPTLCISRMNKLNALPRGFGAFPALEVLDLTYNNLSEKSLPGNFFCLGMNKMIIIIQFLGNYLYIIVHFTKYMNKLPVLFYLGHLL